MSKFHFVQAGMKEEIYKEATDIGLDWQTILSYLIEGGLKLLMQIIADKKAGKTVAEPNLSAVYA